MEIAALEALLRKHEIPFECWDPLRGKDIHTLAEEIVAGESRLEELGGTLIRHLECVSIQVFAHEPEGNKRRLWLREAYQEVRGIRRERKRDWSVCEKRMPRDPTPRACGERAIAEELNITENVHLATTPPREECCESRSFVGLRTIYTIHPMFVFLFGKHYRPEGYVDTSEAPREITYFEWVPC